MFAFAAGETDSPIKATIVLEGIPMKGTVEARRRIIRFLGVPNANHPDAPAAQEAVLDSWRMFDSEANPGFTLTSLNDGVVAEAVSRGFVPRSSSHSPSGDTATPSSQNSMCSGNNWGAPMTI
ncbi:MAG: hypothetical protein ACRDJ4_12405 [Actinomycetota bacterium]